MFILLMSDAFEKSSFSTAGFAAMCFRSSCVFFSLISIVQGMSVSAAFSPLYGHLKLLRPFMIAMFSGLPSFFRMKCFFV